MEHRRLDEMKLGWLIGNFEPSILRTDQFELGIKTYRSGDSEPSHHHKIATEYTVIVSGIVRMAGETWGPGSIIKMPPGESTSFFAIEDAVTVVLKTPSVIGDKYLDE